MRFLIISLLLTGIYSLGFTQSPAVIEFRKIPASNWYQGQSDTTNTRLVERKTVFLTASADRGVTMGDFKYGLQAQDPAGSAPELNISQTIWWEVNQALLKFDLSSLPTGFRVRKAALRLNVNCLSGDATRIRVGVLPPYDAWNESTASYDLRDGQLRWSEGSPGQSIWKQLGSFSVEKSGQWCEINVTRIVRDWHLGKLVNNGFILTPDYSFTHWGDLVNSPGKVSYSSRESTDETLRPQLIIELVPEIENDVKPVSPLPPTPAGLLRVPKPPYVIWYQCPLPDMLRHCNIDASVGGMRWAFEQNERGITPLMWSYGPNSPYAEDPEYYISQYGDQAKAEYPGTAVDEWNVPAGDPKEAWCAEGLRETKRKYPNFFQAVWVTNPTPAFIELVKEGTIDLAMIEGYTYVPDHPEWAISWDALIKDRVELMKQHGLREKTVVCVGFISAQPDSTGHFMSFEELEKEVRYLAENYPQMPGIAFYGCGDTSPETEKLIKLADDLAGQLFCRSISPSW